MNLSELTLPQLRQLQTDLTAELAKREQHQQDEARRQILALAQAAGISLADLVGTQPVRTRKTSEPVPVKYQHPDNPAFHWSGRGRQPAWIKEWEAEHGNLDKLRVI